MVNAYKNAEERRRAIAEILARGVRRLLEGTPVPVDLERATGGRRRSSPPSDTSAERPEKSSV